MIFIKLLLTTCLFLTIIHGSEYTVHGYKLNNVQTHDQTNDIVNFLSSKLNDHFKINHQVYVLHLQDSKLLLISFSPLLRNKKYKDSYEDYFQYTLKSLKNTHTFKAVSVAKKSSGNSILGIKIKNIYEGKLLKICVEEDLDESIFESVKKKLKHNCGTNLTFSAVRYPQFSYFTIEPVEDIVKILKKLEFLKVLSIDYDTLEIQASILD